MSKELEIYWTDFHHIFTVWKVFDHRLPIWPLFRWLKGRCIGNQFESQNLQNRTIHIYLSPWYSETDCNIPILISKVCSSLPYEPSDPYPPRWKPLETHLLPVCSQLALFQVFAQPVPQPHSHIQKTSTPSLVISWQAQAPLANRKQTLTP